MYSARDRRDLPGGVTPFGDPRISLLPATRGLSQVTTSFIASRCQGIHHMPLVAWSKKIDLSSLDKNPGILPGRFPALEISYPLVRSLYLLVLVTLAFNCQRSTATTTCTRCKTVCIQSSGAVFTMACSLGGDDRDRTDDLRLAKPALSQLSYIPSGKPAGPAHARPLRVSTYFGGPG